jgi:hypothetical protein
MREPLNFEEKMAMDTSREASPTLIVGVQRRKP